MPRTVILAALCLGLAALAGGCDGKEQAAVPPAPGGGVPAGESDMPAETPKVPDVFKVEFRTSAGDFVVQFHRDWAPVGVDHIHRLVGAKYYDGCKFLRVVPGFVIQFGINGDPNVSARWESFRLQDDPVKQSNRVKTVTFATAGPDTRTTQLFINLKDNSGLDSRGFAPLGEIVSGWETVGKINGEYGGAPSEHQGRITAEGDAFLEAMYPGLDYIRTARIVD